MPGLIVDTNGITIDLNGHRVHGDSTAGNIGIDLSGHSKVTIKNGLVQGFDKGIYAATDRDVKLVNVEVRGVYLKVRIEAWSKADVAARVEGRRARCCGEPLQAQITLR